MDTNTFYALTSATCFTLAGLWWSVVKDKANRFKEEAKKCLASGVYASFLMPALMSLGAQIAGNNSLICKGVFIIAAPGGISLLSKLISLTRQANPIGAFSKNSWVVPFLYAVILFSAVFPGFAGPIGLQPLQMEGSLLGFLILCAHMSAWKFSTSA